VEEGGVGREVAERRAKCQGCRGNATVEGGEMTKTGTRGGLTEALVDPRRCIPIKHSHRTHRSRTRATYLPCIRGWGWAHTNQEADVVLKPFRDKHMTSPAGPRGPGGFSREGLGTFWGPNSKRIKWGSINGGRKAF
ncbi:hypothetical protein GW17_00057688, partial [Ensete ventricosum]